MYELRQGLRSTQGCKSPFLGCETAPSLGVEQLTPAARRVLLGVRGEAPSLERLGKGWASRSRRTPVPREGPARCSRFSVGGTPPQAIAHPAASSEAPASGRCPGRREVGSTAWRLPPAPYGFPPGSVAPPVAGIPSNSAKRGCRGGKPSVREQTGALPVHPRARVLAGGPAWGGALGAQAREQPAAAAEAAAAMSARPRCRSPAVMSSA